MMIFSIQKIPQKPTLAKTMQITPTPTQSPIHPPIQIPPPFPSAFKQCFNPTRRDVVISTASFSLLTSLELSQRSRVRAEETEKQEKSEKPDNLDDEATVSKTAFLEVSVDGVPYGKIIIGLYGNKAPFGVSRFSNLVSGEAGVSYRRKEFVKIMPTYIQHGGVRSYGVDAELARKAGSDLATDNKLIDEWEKQNSVQNGTKNLVAKSVGIVVRDPMKAEPKMKLVARKGKLEIDQEEVGVGPNGTEFVILSKDEPELEGSVLVIGKVLKGMDVVEKIGKVKTVQENTSSPYFRVAKLIGDKRAVVAERGFNRPYSKVIITNCGIFSPPPPPPSE